jgi:HSP20 family protein
VTGSHKGYVEELARLRDRLHAVLDTALLRSPFAGGAGAPAGGWAPAVDVVETDAAYVLSVEIPGVAREDVELSADGRVLEVSGARPQPADGSFALMERSYGAFRRTFELPAPIDSDAVSAELVAGVLTVTVPKRTAGRRVPIETEGG